MPGGHARRAPLVQPVDRARRVTACSPPARHVTGMSDLTRAALLFAEALHAFLDDPRVVVYDEAGNAWATRVWWLLR